MKPIVCRAALLALGTVLMSVTLSRSPSAMPFADPLKSLSSTGSQLVQARTCSRRAGPFTSQFQAYQYLRQARAMGFTTGPVYGQGGLYSNSANRRWYFAVYFAC